MKFTHIPVMPKEIVELISPKKGGIYVDCTLGGGGHAKLVAELIGKTGKIIGIDQDESAISAAKKTLSSYSDRVIFVKDNFRNLADLLDSAKIPKVDGILIDLGVSSHQIDAPERGFSFKETPENLTSRLDMRMDQNQTLDAYEVVNYYREDQLLKILLEYGEERFAKPIVRGIIQAREDHHVNTVGDLIKVIETSTPAKYRFSKKPGQFASNTFRAIRMEVNDELGVIHDVLPQAFDALNIGGRLVVITFQSLEDRIVKNFFRELGTEKSVSPISRENIPARANILTKKPFTATNEELRINPRSNCAKVRAIEKIY